MAKETICQCPNCGEEFDQRLLYSFTGVRSFLFCPYCKKLILFKFKFGLSPNKAIGFSIVAFTFIPMNILRETFPAKEYPFYVPLIVVGGLIYILKRKSLSFIQLLKSVEVFEVSSFHTIKDFKNYGLELFMGLFMLTPLVSCVIFPLILQKNTLTASLVLSFGFPFILYFCFSLLLVIPFYYLEKRKVLKALN